MHIIKSYDYCSRKENFHQKYIGQFYAKNEERRFGDLRRKFDTSWFLIEQSPIDNPSTFPVGPWLFVQRILSLLLCKSACHAWSLLIFRRICRGSHQLVSFAMSRSGQATSSCLTPCDCWLTVAGHLLIGKWTKVQNTCSKMRSRGQNTSSSYRQSETLCSILAGVAHLNSLPKAY